MRSTTPPLNDSAILNTLDDSLVEDLQQFLGEARPLSQAKLLYRGSQDGFMPADWRRLCEGQSNLLTIIRVKGNGYVFGAFTPFQWRGPGQSWIADLGNATFLFSLVNAHNRAVKLTLQESKNGSTGMSSLNSGPGLSTAELALQL